MSLTDQEKVRDNSGNLLSIPLNLIEAKSVIKKTNGERNYVKQDKFLAKQAKFKVKTS